MPSIKTVADTAKVSTMTVSRVLRNSPHVSSTTRAAVMDAAHKVGYRPNPQIAKLMSLVRGAKQLRVGTVLGVVWDDSPNDELPDSAYQFVSNQDIAARATQHGYAVEEFFLRRGGITPTRLTGILRARGIEGLIISPRSSCVLSASLDFSSFASVTFGYSLGHPALHRASTNMTQGIMTAAQMLQTRGYARIGLAIPHFIDLRSGHTYSGAMLHFLQNVLEKHRVPPLFFSNNPTDACTEFCAWIRKHKPDALISLDAHVPEWLTRRLMLRIPEDIGFVVDDWTDRMAGFAGINHRRQHVAAAAVDLVATQLMHNEHGIPQVPRHILISPEWVDGPSIRSCKATATR